MRNRNGVKSECLSAASCNILCRWNSGGLQLQISLQPETVHSQASSGRDRPLCRQRHLSNT